jgi:apolipoprotein N-acyltransferase
MMMLCANCIITIAPPLGLLTWGHPIAAAGILFPDLSWAGIILWLLLITCLMQIINIPRLHVKSFIVCMAICAISILSNVLHSDSSFPQNWHVISTDFSQKASDLNIVEKSNRHQSLQAQIIDLNKEKRNVVIFPENIIGYWNNADSFLWKNWIKHSPYPHLTVLLGAHQKFNASQFHNSIMIISKDNVNAYSARMSMPVGNYNPFAKYSARIFPFNSDVKEIAGKKTAFFICYESVLPWFHLLSQSQNPEIIIVASNLWWASNTTLPRAMENYVYAVSRLFNSPILHANNM